MASSCSQGNPTQRLNWAWGSPIARREPGHLGIWPAAFANLPSSFEIWQCFSARATPSPQAIPR
ncbi:hypothetical protein HYDPIDRAFT_108051 [Hydnomerulius pinastri MD-312]|nr:hypothetical protein HYDPIDRAFT_108051 [Hydnomerulius pinastri MD-312]